MSIVTAMQLEVESIGVPHADNHGGGPSGQRALRPAGVSLQNDGFHPYWAVPGYTYHIDHDGTGYAVREYAVGGHVFRLASAPNTLTDTVRTVEGATYTLDPSRSYTLTASVKGELTLTEV